MNKIKFDVKKKVSNDELQEEEERKGKKELPYVLWS